ncbi:hypothetical protein DFJ58DRAFT_735256 [Suillus subalutaceus]|uniref:uncharacterized protein n=1 Tax=Suillus subalutaceus TaxID=48586 RepID=UPI001B86F711|nr:uncharacterized protein DFJ58DRAFT_735256 [Suillus subalutaceus]KAG1836037.1 hypothetical protein DFJ58DRAFT_735256 [Suillus subalutaceus]
MKLSLVFGVLASIVVLATAYPTEGTTGIAKRSNVEKRDLDAIDDAYAFGEYDKRDLDAIDDAYAFGEYDKRDSEGLDAVDNA